MRFRERVGKLLTTQLPPWRTAAVLVALLGVLVALALPDTLRWPSYGTYDWIAYWSTVRAPWFGSAMYDPGWLAETQRSVGYDPTHYRCGECVHIPLWNPPFALLPLLPLGALPFAAATRLWALLTVLFAGSAAFLYVKTLPAALPGWVVLVITYLLMPVDDVLYFGQMACLLIFALTFAWYAQRHERQASAGVLLALQFLKPHLLWLVTLYMLWVAFRRRQWRLIGAFTAMSLFLIGAVLLVDPQSLTGWARQGTIPWQSSAPFHLAENAFHLLQGTRYVGLAIGIMSLWRFRQRTVVSTELVAYLSLLSILLAPHIWFFDTSVLLLTALWISSIVWKKRWGQIAILLCSIVTFFKIAVIGGGYVRHMLFMIGMIVAWIVAEWLRHDRALSRQPVTPPC